MATSDSSLGSNQAPADAQLPSADAQPSPAPPLELVNNLPQLMTIEATMMYTKRKKLSNARHRIYGRTMRVNLRVGFSLILYINYNYRSNTSHE